MNYIALTFAQLVEQFQQISPNEAAVVLLDDPYLLAYTVYFKQCPPERLLMGGEDVEPVDRTWRSLWECVRVDYEAIALLADDELVMAKKMIERLKGLRLIYPDGTLPRIVEKVLEKRLHGQLGAC